MAELVTPHFHCRPQPTALALHSRPQPTTPLNPVSNSTSQSEVTIEGAESVRGTLDLSMFDLGLSLDQVYMSKEVKTKMRDEFERFLPEYGLTDLYYRSFMQVHGFGFKLSAADVVYGVTALLESKPGSFWDAYSALSLNNLDELKKGKECAIEVKMAILSQGSKAITKSGFIRSGRKFRWVKLEDPVDVEKLGRPLALTKFCYFLLDALKERGAQVKPLICCCMAKERNRILVVGVCNKPRIGAVKGNEFGVVFKAAAREFEA